MDDYVLNSECGPTSIGNSEYSRKVREYVMDKYFPISEFQENESSNQESKTGASLIEVNRDRIQSGIKTIDGWIMKLSKSVEDWKTLIKSSREEFNQHLEDMDCLKELYLGQDVLRGEVFSMEKKYIDLIDSINREINPLKKKIDIRAKIRGMKPNYQTQKIISLESQITRLKEEWDREIGNVELVSSEDSRNCKCKACYKFENTCEYRKLISQEPIVYGKNTFLNRLKSELMDHLSKYNEVILLDQYHDDYLQYAEKYGIECDQNDEDDLISKCNYHHLEELIGTGITISVNGVKDCQDDCTWKISLTKYSPCNCPNRYPGWTWDVEGYQLITNFTIFDDQPYGTPIQRV